MTNREHMKQILEQMAFPVYEGKAHLASREGVRREPSVTAVVFLGSDIDLESALEVLKRFKAAGKPLVFVFSEAAERLLSVSKLSKRFKPSEVITGQPYERLRTLIGGLETVYVPNLTQNTAAKLAVGIQDDFVTNLVWQSLASGIPVYAGTAAIENAWFNLSANPAMAATFKGHLETLKRYGMSFEWQTVAPAAPGACRVDAYVTLSDELAQKVVTERHILGLAKGSRLGLKKGVRITPLAREAARDRQIELLQMEEGNDL